jgi:hypothetical protein
VPKPEIPTYHPHHRVKSPPHYNAAFAINQLPFSRIIPAPLVSIEDERFFFEQSPLAAEVASFRPCEQRDGAGSDWDNKQTDTHCDFR